MRAAGIILAMESESVLGTTTRWHDERSLELEEPYRRHR
jgi:hypothetical protein